MDALVKLSKDLKKAATTMTRSEARYLVDSYYQVQEYRISIANQIRSIDCPVFYDEDGKKRKPTEEEIAQHQKEPHEVLDWMLENLRMLENNIKKALESYTDQEPIGQWMKQVIGIGPVIAAGLLSHIDITKAPTAGHIWSFAGLNPSVEWKKGEKRPWNAKLKMLCWKVGQSFVKVSGNPDSVYGRIYRERKEYEQQLNEKLVYKDQAEAKLKKYNIGKTTTAYQWYIQGKLPPAHIQQRAERMAVKIFLSHLHETWYRMYWKREPPVPYVIEHLGHVHRSRPEVELVTN